MQLLKLPFGNVWKVVDLSSAPVIYNVMRGSSMYLIMLSWYDRAFLIIGPGWGVGEWWWGIRWCPMDGSYKGWVTKSLCVWNSFWSNIWIVCDLWCHEGHVITVLYWYRFHQNTRMHAMGLYESKMGCLMWVKWLVLLHFSLPWLCNIMSFRFVSTGLYFVCVSPVC